MREDSGSVINTGNQDYEVDAGGNKIDRKN
jgi:hypothetical protein